MLIISNYKDFYDWVVFETDNRKIYNRVKSEVEKSIIARNWKEPHLYSVGAIFCCGKRYKFVKYLNNIYWKYSDIPEEYIKTFIKKQGKWWWYKKDKGSWEKALFGDLGLSINSKTNEPLIFDINVKHKCPVIMEESEYSNKLILNPKLDEIGFNKILKPTEIYQDIYNFIPYVEPELPGGPDDMDRYSSKGFDIKTSFRPKMK